MAAPSAEGLRLRDVPPLAESDLRTKHLCGTGGPWAYAGGVERARVGAASCRRPGFCAHRSRPPGATPRCVPGAPSIPSSASSPSSSRLSVMILGDLEAAGAVRRPRAPAGQSWTKDKGSVVTPATGCGQGASSGAQIPSWVLVLHTPMHAVATSIDSRCTRRGWGPPARPWPPLR